MLKVCGMRNADNIRDVAKLFPDFMGFIFYPGSKRYVGDNFTLPEEFPDKIKRVGVFVNASTDEINRLTERHSLDFIQLHGDESVDQCLKLCERGLKIIKAFQVDSKFDFNTLSIFENCVEYFLFDTKSGGRGGSGLTFDWKLLKGYGLKVPFILSGGISLENIRQSDVLNDARLFAIDINSRFELEPGIKDVNLIRELKKSMGV